MVVDLHCDLLSHPTFHHDDPAVRCSPSQLIEGKVHCQVCAIFTEGGRKGISLDEQNSLFFSLPKGDPRILHITYDNPYILNDAQETLQIVRSIENASGLGDEDVPLEEIFHKLAQLVGEGPVAYLGLVWNGRNRFGGGVLDPYPLTSDGKHLLEWMHELRIPVDLSHCCDRLADDILDYTLDKLPNMPVLASHSNFRSVQAAPRNLLDPHAKEIAHRGGVIGMNIVNYFVGSSLKDLQKHLAHAKELGILNRLVLGTDFFYSEEAHKFFPDCSTARDHLCVRSIIEEYLPEDEADQLLRGTASVFLQEEIVRQKDRIQGQEIPLF